MMQYKIETVWPGVEVYRGEPPTEPKILVTTVEEQAAELALLRVASLAASCFAEMRPDLQSTGARALAGLVHDAQLACDRIQAYIIEHL